MAWKLLSGVRQDHKGRAYQVRVNSLGREELVYLESQVKPFSFTLSHKWTHHADDKITVRACPLQNYHYGLVRGKMVIGCAVCGPNRTADFYSVEE